MTHLRAVVGQVTPRMPGMPTRSAPRLADLTVFFLFAAQGVRNLVGWPGYIVVACCLLGAIVWSLRGYRNDVRLLLLPPELLAFLLFCASSVLWANYQWVTVIGVLAQWAAAAAGIWLALSLSWDELLAVLRSALVRMLAISLAFEVFVTFAVGQRLAPLWTDYGDEAPGAFYWSENLLLVGGPIQGIPGNRNLLAFAAILALVTVGARIAAGVRGRWPVASIVIALVTLALTRSATAIAVAAAVAAVFAVVLIVRRFPRRARRLAQAGVLAVAAVACAAVLSVLPTALSLLGRSDLTNRVDIWRTVLQLAEQRPALGWGWVGYWAPWVHPYDGLVVIDGVEYLQAHNALLDVVLQLGVVGGVVASMVAAGSLARGWARALGTDGALARVHPLTACWPLLLVCALLAQSLTESRLLIEGNWALLVALTAKLAIEDWSRSGKAPFTRSEPAPVSIGP